MEGSPGPGDKGPQVDRCSPWPSGKEEKGHGHGLQGRQSEVQTSLSQWHRHPLIRHSGRRSLAPLRGSWTDWGGEAGDDWREGPEV